MKTPPSLPPELQELLAPERPEDVRFMRVALEEARLGRGRTSSNPSVGCVIVKDGKILGRGHHRKAGTGHGEVVAFADAEAQGNDVRGATLYVTLEPCSHHGKTPPCADLCVRKGVGRVVAALVDPFPEVSGRGLKRLAAAGIEVTCGVEAAAAWRVHLPFLTRVLHKRPHVTAKVGMSLDGRIATRSGASFPLTGEEARREVHLLRDRVDAILVGRGTAAHDDPRLTCRLSLEDAGDDGPKDPVRVVLDPHARLTLDLQIFHLQARGESSAPTLLVSLEGQTGAERRACLEKLGVELLECRSGRDGKLDLVYLLRQLYEREVCSLLVEGGGETLASFFEADLIDVWIAHVAPVLIGGRGATSPLGGEGVYDLNGLRPFGPLQTRPLGADIEIRAQVKSDVYGLD